MIYNRFIYGTLKGSRVEKLGVSKLEFNNNNFTFDILYEGKNGYTLYKPKGYINDDGAYIILNPKINQNLLPFDQLYHIYQDEEITYNEVLILLERSIKHFKKN